MLSLGLNTCVLILPSIQSLSLQQEAFNQRPLLVRNPALLSGPHKLALTRFALVIRLPLMAMTILLEPLGSTLWATLSRNHSALLGLP